MPRKVSEKEAKAKARRVKEASKRAAQYGRSEDNKATKAEKLAKEREAKRLKLMARFWSGRPIPKHAFGKRKFPGALPEGV